MHELEAKVQEVEAEMATIKGLLWVALDVAEENETRPKANWCKVSHAWVKGARKALGEDVED